STRFSSVVLPEPKKPVKIVAGIKDITTSMYKCAEKTKLK
ncbi:MAG: hypothetical protein ACJA1Y_001543, partial [Burkholderiaceae bacterium]